MTISRASLMQRWWVRYGIAIAAVALATLLRAAIDSLWGSTSPFILYYPAIMLAVVIGGRGPALLSTVLGGLIGEIFFMHPRGQLNLDQPAEAIQLALFLGIGVFMSCLGGVLHAARRRAEALQQEQSRLAAAVDATDVMLACLDRDFNFLAVNPAYARGCTKRPEDLVGRNHFALYPHAENEAIFRRVRETGVPVFCKDKPFQFPDQPERGVTYWDWSLTPVKDHAAEVTGLVFSLRETTKYKQAEEALKESEAKYRSLFDNMSEGFAVGEALCEADGTPCDFRLLEMNRAFERQSGLTGDILGKPMKQVLPNLERHWIDSYCSVALSGKPVHFDAPNEDTRRHYEVFCYSPARGRFAIIFTDITERKGAERALREAMAAAEQASKAKDQFIAVLSHELRTPLTPAIAAMSLLRTDTRLPPDVHEDLEMVSRNLDLEVRLIADLLDVSRVISGKLHVEKRDMDVADAIREAAGIVAGDLDAKGQTLTIEMPDAPYPAFADAARLQQVFWNLLRNSIKFSPERSRIVVRAERVGGCQWPVASEDTPATGSSQLTALQVEVIDQGSGIATDVLSRIFDAFEQEQKARSFGGLGLGLAICKAVIELHGGAISAHSEGAGCGATFVVRLPIAQHPLSPAGARAPRDRANAASESPRHNRHRLRILLVEDHVDTARLIRRLLMGEGHEVFIAGSVAEGLAAVQEHKPDVLISDLGLPDGSGLDLMQQLLARGQRVPAIAISGYGTPADIAKSTAAGFAEHLVKPLNSFEMLTGALTRLGVRNDQATTPDAASAS